MNYDTFPTNNTESARPYIYSKIVTLESNALNTLDLEIDEVTFSTDVSILPYSVIETKRTFKLSNNHYDNFRIPYLSKYAAVSLQIRYSKLNEVHERKYFSLADALSFIGGIFTFLFGILSTVLMGFREFSY